MAVFFCLISCVNDFLIDFLRRLKSPDRWDGNESSMFRRQVQNAGRNKKVRHSAGLFMFVYLFHFRTSQSGICVASTMLPVVLRVKELKLHIVLELEEFFLSFGFLETSKRCFNLRSTRRNLD